MAERCPGCYCEQGEWACSPPGQGNDCPCETCEEERSLEEWQRADPVGYYRMLAERASEEAQRAEELAWEDWRDYRDEADRMWAYVDRLEWDGPD